MGAIFFGPPGMAVLLPNYAAKPKPYTCASQPFMVFGLPRSRTAWFSTALSMGSKLCHHEIETTCDDLPEFVGRVANTGNCSTLAWKVLPDLKHYFPSMRYAWLDADPERIAASSKALGHPMLTREMLSDFRAEAELLGALDQLVVDVEDLTFEKVGRVWSHLIVGSPFPESKIRNLLRMNVQLTDREFHRVASHPVPWLMEASIL